MQLIKKSIPFSFPFSALIHTSLVIDICSTFLLFIFIFFDCYKHCISSSGTTSYLKELLPVVSSAQSDGNHFPQSSPSQISSNFSVLVIPVVVMLTMGYGSSVKTASLIFPHHLHIQQPGHLLPNPAFPKKVRFYDDIPYPDIYIYTQFYRETVFHTVCTIANILFLLLLEPSYHLTSNQNKAYFFYVLSL